MTAAAPHLARAQHSASPSAQDQPLEGHDASEHLIDFCLAIAGRTDRQLDIHAQRGSNSPWGPSFDRCFAVYTCNKSMAGCKTLALDFDTKLGRAVDDADRAMELLRDAGIRAAMTASGGGGRHILATFCPTVLWEHVKLVVLSLMPRFPSLDSARTAIRPPGSLHKSLRTGSRTLQPPLEALATLREGNPPEAFRRLAQHLQVPLLGSKARQYLKTGARVGERSQAINAVLLSAANDRADAATVVDMVLDSPLGEKAREKSDPKGWLHARYDEALTYADQHPPVRAAEDVRAMVECLRAALPLLKWQGQAGGSELVLLFGHLNIIEVAGVEYHASTRVLARESHLTHRSVSDGNRRLVRDGWLVSRGRPTRDSGEERTLGPKARSLHTQSLGNTHMLGSVQSLILHPVFTQGGLGRKRGQVHAVLGTRASWEIEELARQLNMQRKTAQARLNVLRNYGFASPRGSEWQALQGDADEVAREFGMDSQLHRRNMRYDIDCKAWRSRRM